MQYSTKQNSTKLELPTFTQKTQSIKITKNCSDRNAEKTNLNDLWDSAIFSSSFSVCFKSNLYSAT